MLHRSISSGQNSDPDNSNDITSDSNSASTCNGFPHNADRKGDSEAEQVLSPDSTSNSTGDNNTCNRYQGSKIWDGYCHPDGSVTIGRSSNKKSAKDEKYDRDTAKIYEPTETYDWTAGDEENLKEKRGLRLREDKVAECLPPKLDPPAKLSQPKKRYGQNGISRDGKKAVRNGCSLLERQYKGRIGLCTVTLPSEVQGLDKSDLWFISQQWAIFKKRFLQEFKRLLKRKGAPTEAISCTEIQEKRFRNRGEMAPHLHICYVAKPTNRAGNYYVSPSEVRGIVKRVIFNMLDREGITAKGIELPPINCNNSVNLQIIKKSAANYLSKYMSKGGEILDEIKEAGLGGAIPTQWWSPIGGMREWIKKNTVKLSQNICNFLASASRDDEGIEYIRSISIERQGRTVVTKERGRGGKMIIKEEEPSELLVGIYIKPTRYLFELISGIPWDKPLSI